MLSSERADGPLGPAGDAHGEELQPVGRRSTDTVDRPAVRRKRVGDCAGRGEMARRLAVR